MFLGDGLDYEGGPSLACSPNRVCMMVGFSGALPGGTAWKGGIWARLFNSQTLQPLTGIFYLDDHSNYMDTPQVVYNTRAGKFSALWYRRTGNVVDFRQVSVDGTPGPLDLTKSFGPGAGDLGYAYNEKTGNALLVTKVGNSAELWGLEIGDQGYPTGKNALITTYNPAGWPTYSVQVTPNPSNGTWLVAYMLSNNGWLALMKGGASAPTSNPVVNIDGPGPGHATQAFDVRGFAIDLGSATTSGSDTVHLWALPPNPAAPIFLGAATPDIARSDVASAYGSRFANSGYSFRVNSLAPGPYTLAVFMHSTVTDTFNAVDTVDVYVLNAPIIGTETSRATDFDGDARSEFTVYNPSNGVWSSLKSSSSWGTATNISWGGPDYAPVPGDYDGDGKTDLGVYQESSGNWYVLLSSSGYTTSLYKNAGGAGWTPVQSDFDGDGKTDFAVYNRSSGLWYGLKSGSGYTTSLAVNWGGAGYIPAPGDFDGDGKADLAVYDGSSGNWYVLLSAANYTTGMSKNVGGAGYTPVQADYDGDGKTDFAVYNTSTGLWYGLKSGSGYSTTVAVYWGGAGYTPVRGDLDGDGKADLSVYQLQTGNWYVLLSSTSYQSGLGKNWGGPGYIAVPPFQ